MSSKPGYKQTEIGEIPEDWKVRHLGENDISLVIMGQSPPSSSYNQAEKGIPFLQGNADFGEMYPTPRVYTTKPIKIAEKNDILLSVRAPVGDVNINVFQSCIGRGLSAIRPSSKTTYNHFIYYLLKSLKPKFESLAVGSTFAAINAKDIQCLHIAIPTLPEQQKIASILSTVDEAIQKTDEIIAKTEELKKGLMKQLLTKGIGHTRFKQTEIGEIPEEWEIASLNSVATEIFSGGTPPTEYSEYWNGDIPWMRSAWISGTYVTTGEKNITKKGLSNSATKIVPKENVLIASRVCIGNVAINKIDIAISQDLTGIILDKNKINPEYLLYVLLIFSKKIRALVQGSTIKGILQSDLKQLTIPLPSLSEQQKISQILLELENRIILETEKRAHLVLLKKGLSQLLLTGKIRVKVN